jgi:hypothetical protein
MCFFAISAFSAVKTFFQFVSISFEIGSDFGFRVSFGLRYSAFGFPAPRGFSSQDSVHHLPMDVREPEVAALKTEAEFFMIESQQVENGAL